MIHATASENYMSEVVRKALGTIMGSNYFFDPPRPSKEGEWSFPLSGVPQRWVEKLATSASILFETQLIDWRPNGGSIAEDAVMMGVCKKGDALIHFSHSQGGHFAIEPLADRMEIKCFHLPVDERTLLIDVASLALVLIQHPEIKLVMLDQSFKLRWQPVEDIKRMLPDGVILSYDCSHDGGLIAGGQLPQPIACGADIIFGNTHKTIFGPQKAFVGWANKDHWSVDAISKAIVPTLQSNCHAECLLPMLLSFKELEIFGKEYARQIIKNAKTFATVLHEEGFNVSGESFGFTETHQVHVTIGTPEDALKGYKALENIGIRVNTIEIPGQRGKHGFRFGTQAMTRRSMKEDGFSELAKLIAKHFNGAPAKEIRPLIEDIGREHPVFPLAYSFDAFMHEDWMKNFLNEI